MLEVHNPLPIMAERISLTNVDIESLLSRIWAERTEIGAETIKNLALDIRTLQQSISQINSSYTTLLCTLQSEKEFVMKVPDELSYQDIDTLRSVLGADNFNVLFGYHEKVVYGGFLGHYVVEYSFSDFDADKHSAICFRAPEGTRSHRMQDATTNSKDQVQTRILNTLDDLNSELKLSMVSLEDSYSKYTNNTNALLSDLKKLANSVEEVTHGLRKP